MAKITTMRQHKTYLQVKASTLVEVLVALVILLSVFAIGMVIFVRLMQASESKTQQLVKLHLQQIKHAYLDGEWKLDQQQAFEQLSYSVEEEEMNDFSDRKKVKVFAFDEEQKQLMDSLIFIMPVNNEQ